MTISILIKVIICAIIIGWSIAGQCMHRLRDSFHTTWDCNVFEYVHECSIPSNGLNMVIFDIDSKTSIPLNTKKLHPKVSCDSSNIEVILKCPA